MTWKLLKREKKFPNFDETFIFLSRMDFIPGISLGSHFSFLENHYDMKTFENVRTSFQILTKLLYFSCFFPAWIFICCCFSRCYRLGFETKYLFYIILKRHNKNNLVIGLCKYYVNHGKSSEMDKQIHVKKVADISKL